MLTGSCMYDKVRCSRGAGEAWAAGRAAAAARACRCVIGECLQAAPPARVGTAHGLTSPPRAQIVLVSAWAKDRDMVVLRIEATADEWKQNGPSLRSLRNSFVADPK